MIKDDVFILELAEDELIIQKNPIPPPVHRLVMTPRG